MTTSEVARRSGVTPDAVRDWERCHKLPAIRTGSGQRLFVEDEVQRFLAERERRRAGRTRPTAPGEAQ